MARPSPQTDRIVLVAQLLAADPGVGRTLAEIARYLGVAKATCYPMLIALTESGWLIRHPERGTYQLGPALIGIGQAASRALDVLDLARPLMRDLADASGMSVLGFSQSAADLVVSEICHPESGPRSALGLRLGDRLRLLPPLGAALIAQLSPERVDDWCRDGVGDVDSGDESRIDARVRDLEVVNKRGYAVECLDSAELAFADIVIATRGVGMLGREGLERQREILQRISPTHLVGELDPGATYRPVSISAAVVGAGGQANLILACVDGESPMSGGRVAEVGTLVRDATERLGALIGVAPR